MLGCRYCVFAVFEDVHAIRLPDFGYLPLQLLDTLFDWGLHSNTLIGGEGRKYRHGCLDDPEFAFFATTITAFDNRLLARIRRL
jgi:hypothetical protein